MLRSRLVRVSHAKCTGDVARPALEEQQLNSKLDLIRSRNWTRRKGFPMSTISVSAQGTSGHDGAVVVIPERLQVCLAVAVYTLGCSLGGYPENGRCKPNQRFEGPE